jgi:hypothetical protein
LLRSTLFLPGAPIRVKLDTKGDFVNKKMALICAHPPILRHRYLKAPRKILTTIKNSNGSKLINIWQVVVAVAITRSAVHHLPFMPFRIDQVLLVWVRGH